MAWTPAQLDRIGSSEELQITSYYENGALRDWTTIWVVRVHNDLYIRSAYGQSGGWYRHAMHTRGARVRAHGVETDVTLHPVTDSYLNDRVRKAYESKYRDHPSALEPMLAPAAENTTLRMDPVG
ncbi:DUF2255 family protein [Nocardia africana]|uniref:Uncharacterized protein conserved in bacteria (DUF2255) n=1 Tax=Nocardia africana TaxID=134964 RepID=A0A378X0E1_9NOCA|nr:DUF2255 family protein [Nocardia africana]MCC3311818.1 DUF2255 family protein [Nocardia africana]SUA46909.1 Uncharacterized protein conserved in bacteria (DUF2255) [Nocardia africana]